MKENNFFIYETDNNVEVTAILEDENVWLTQEQIGKLYNKAKSTINEHIKNIYLEHELEENNTMSIISLIIAIVGLILIFFKPYLTGIAGIISIILGAMGRKQGAKSIGTAGMIIGIVDTALVVLMLIAVIVMAVAVVFAAM